MPSPQDHLGSQKIPRRQSRLIEGIEILPTSTVKPCPSPSQTLPTSEVRPSTKCQPRPVQGKPKYHLTSSLQQPTKCRLPAEPTSRHNSKPNRLLLPSAESKPNLGLLPSADYMPNQLLEANSEPNQLQDANSMPNQLPDSNSKPKLFHDGDSKLIHLPSTNPKPFLLLSAISSQTKANQLQDAISKFNRLQDANSRPI